jgi:hypothetical protein
LLKKQHCSSWFLALYLLQPTERRRVLAIDSSAAFDSSNQAAWPAAAGLVNCERSDDDTGLAERVKLEEAPRDLQADLEQLGMVGEMLAPA